MKMKDYFSLIEQHKDSSRTVAAVIVEGTGTGSRFLFSEGRMVFADSENILTENEQRDIAGIDSTGLINSEGRKIFAEILIRPSRLVICGGGHVAQQVIVLAKRIGFEVWVLEDRPFFADEARKAGADQVICDSFERGMREITGSASTFFLVVTRGHRFDGVCLREIFKKPYAYVGMMASRGRAALLKKQLESDGVARDDLDKMHTPVGLSIHAETPEEIAVSIAAELIMVKNSEKKTEGLEELLPYLTGREEADKDMVLATIVSRQGSAPRSTGTKMLVFEDGRLVGTLGGGCMEAEVRRKCLHMLRTDDPHSRLEKADLTGNQAEEEGLVCGGHIQVFLERV